MPSKRKHTTQKTLRRKELAQAIFELYDDLSAREARRLVDSVIEEMIAAVAFGETLKLHGFGSFVVREQRERIGRNPHTGTAVTIEARRSVVFKASPNMKAKINEKRRRRRT
jgi:integration host factor subunit alpha